MNHWSLKSLKFINDPYLKKKTSNKTSLLTISNKHTLYSIKDHHSIVWPLIRCQLLVANKPVKSHGCVTIELAAQRNHDRRAWPWLAVWNFEFGRGLKRNFFDWVRQICSEYSLLIRCQLLVANKPVKSLGSVTIKLAAQRIMNIMRDLYWQFGISNLAGDFNTNFFDWDRQIYLKNWFFFSKNWNSKNRWYFCNKL